MSTHSLPYACLVVVLGSPACGPSTLDSGSETQSSTDDAGSTATTSSSSQPPDPTTDAPTSEADPTGTPDTTTGELPDTTTGEPIDCPKGQTPFAARWATVVQQPEFKDWGVEGMAVRPDGQIALLGAFDTEEGPRGYGVILLSKDGELLGTHVGPLRAESPVLAGIAPDGADGWVVLGGWLADTPMPPFLGRFAGDGGFIEEVAPGLPHDVWDAKLGMLDTPVLFGRNFIDDTLMAVGTKIAADGVGSDWTVVIDPSPMGLPLAIASDEVGQVLFVSGPGSGDGELGRTSSTARASRCGRGRSRRRSPAWCMTRSRSPAAGRCCAAEVRSGRSGCWRWRRPTARRCGTRRWPRTTRRARRGRLAST
ncbi:hypothetical protein OV079_07495 [Nannocystis pusilla]|uniref:Uncharacterized protein n=1 Tax=Nannocystis pusilla TaxID=889268 RepID=A0A9X3ETX7_9BACT|nr:hypothetical protein [Nannocystis pusilla]MCY1005418.1 hypothetical protein [Nannocystis pusilla]